MTPLDLTLAMKGLIQGRIFFLPHDHVSLTLNSQVGASYTNMLIRSRIWSIPQHH